MPLSFSIDQIQCCTHSRHSISACEFINFSMNNEISLSRNKFHGLNFNIPFIFEERVSCSIYIVDKMIWKLNLLSNEFLHIRQVFNILSQEFSKQETPVSGSVRGGDKIPRNWSITEKQNFDLVIGFLLGKESSPKTHPLLC